MALKIPKLPWKVISSVAGVLILIIIAATVPQWWPRFSDWVDGTLAGFNGTNTEAEDEAGHAAHDTGADSLILTPNAQRNLGLTAEHLRPVELQPYYQSLTVPAVVTGRPGRTQLHVSTPMTGIVTHVHAVTGETVQPGDLLFEIRLTHEDLVDAQTQFLETLEELDVEQAEIEWLEGASTVEGRLLRDRQYARDRLDARQLALREALKLHGLSERQVDWIADERRLLDTLQIVAPGIDTHSPDEELRLSGVVVIPVSLDEGGTFSQIDHHADEDGKAPLLIETLNVHKGETVFAGGELCVLADYRNLYIEGQAFEHDSAAVLTAVEQGWRFTAVIDSPLGSSELRDLNLAYVSNVIDPVTRVLPFYVQLENEIVVDTAHNDDHSDAISFIETSGEQSETAPEVIHHEPRYVTWRYRPGQRLRLQVPLVELQSQIVLPVEAVAEEGADFFVFRQNGRERFDRVAVHIVHRDSEEVVIAQDGAIFPGDVIARRSAHEMQMALQNKSGGAIDPHAGHSH